jgi:hypothetical protein
MPPGYRPGTTLARLVRDLPGLLPEPLAPDRVRLSQPGASWTLEVTERPQSHLLMHIVTCRFCVSLPGSAAGKALISISHTGLIKRKGLRGVIRKGHSTSLAGWLNQMLADPTVCAALLPLDFKFLSLIQDEHGWRIEMEPFAASEVVNRFPSYRRYVRLTHDQAQHVLTSLSLLYAWLSLRITSL